MRRTLLFLVLVIGASAMAWGQGRCAGTQLRVRHHSDDAGAGQRQVIYSFTNRGYRRCTLKGYPGFALLNRYGRRMSGINIVRTGDPANLVTLSPGGKAFFHISYSSCGTVGEPPCRTSSKVTVTPPRSNRAFIIRERLDPFQGKINLSPVRDAEMP